MTTSAKTSSLSRRLRTRSWCGERRSWPTWSWQRLSLRKLLKALGDNLLVLRIGQLDEILSCQLQVGHDRRSPHQDLVRKRLLNEFVLADVVMRGDHTRQLLQLRAA